MCFAFIFVSISLEPKLLFFLQGTKCFQEVKNTSEENKICSCIFSMLFSFAWYECPELKCPAAMQMHFFLWLSPEYQITYPHFIYYKESLRIKEPNCPISVLLKYKWNWSTLGLQLLLLWLITYLPSAIPTQWVIVTLKPLNFKIILLIFLMIWTL